jgi:rhamnosyltransferase subunit B
MMTRMPENIASKRILFAIIGSLGDLHPCIALALDLKQRGHSVTIASTEFYRAKVEELGLAFHSMRPNWNPTDSDLIAQCEELKRGPEILLRKMVLPHLRDTYDDLFAASADADLILAGELVYAAPLVAEKRGLPWVSIILSPMSFFSSYDPSVLVTVPQLIKLRKFGRHAYCAGVELGRLATRHWTNPIRKFRKELGLSKGVDPVFNDKFSEHLVLALFSRELAERQPDWPPQTLQPGFVRYDRQSKNENLLQLEKFLAAGEPPIVFTLGSSAAHHPGNFYEVSLEAAKQLGRRAILIGIKGESQSAGPNILILRYAPYSEVFPSAAVIVHQGGSGTTAQAMSAGKPMLFVPFGWDQPDNAARIERKGAGLAVSRKTYSVKTAVEALNRLLTEPGFTKQAAEIQSSMEKNALAKACDAIESVLQKTRIA